MPASYIAAQYRIYTVQHRGFTLITGAAKKKKNTDTHGHADMDKAKTFFC